MALGRLIGEGIRACTSAGALRAGLCTAPAALLMSSAAGRGLHTIEVTSVGASNVEDADHVGVVAHGLLGTGRNWRSFSKRLADGAHHVHGRTWAFLLVDLRNHGKTAALTGFHAPHNMESAAADIAGFVRRRLGGRSPDVAVGHSLGGKIVLEYLKQVQEGHFDGIETPKQTWVLDSQPWKVQPHLSQDVLEVLDAIASIELPVASRHALHDAMSKNGFSEDLIQWMCSNLVPAGGGKQGLVWNFNLTGASAMFASYRHTCYLDLLRAPPQGAAVHLVRGARSDRWDDASVETLTGIAAEAKSNGAGAVHMHELPDAGHWLHTDNPLGLHNMMVRELGGM